MPTKKTVNYDEKTLAILTSIYMAAGTDLTPEGEAKRAKAVKEIEIKTGKTPPSIRSKLGQLKLYIPKTPPVAKRAGDTKEKILTDIVENTSEVDGFFDSLSGTTKAVLLFVRSNVKKVNSLQERVNQLSEFIESSDLEVPLTPEESAKLALEQAQAEHDAKQAQVEHASE